MRTVAETGHAVADGIRDTHTAIDENERARTKLMLGVDREPA